MSEPDLQVLATYVPGIDRTVLVWAVSIGVGLFLMVCMVRILLASRCGGCCWPSTPWCSSGVFVRPVFLVGVL